MAVKKQVVAKATFIESMECLPVTTLPAGPEWTYEIKLDGFRLEAVKMRAKRRFTPDEATFSTKNFSTSPMPSKNCLIRPFLMVRSSR